MEEKFIRKMIEQCFAQYDIEKDWLNANESIEKVYTQVLHRYREEEGELYELIEDVVYEFVTA